MGNLSNYLNNKIDSKFYFMRHAETIYNTISDKSAKYNPIYADCHLSTKGIEQSRNKQEYFNKLNIEAIYCSPYFRAIETMINCLEAHPNKENIIIYIHPKLAELAGMMQEFIIDINETKEKFNMESNIKVNWDIFDEYANKLKYRENLFFMDNWDLIEENKREEIYKKLIDIYDKKDMKIYKEEVANIIKERYKTKLKFESYSHTYQRFLDFKNFIYEKHKDTMNDLDKKIIAISHKLFISIATSIPESVLNGKGKVSLNCLSLNNCELAPFSL